MVANFEAPNLDVSTAENNPVWRHAYQNLFLSEYYMRCKDDGVTDPTILNPALERINKYTIVLANAQGRFGTFGHSGSILTSNGSLHGVIPHTGAVNCVGIAANLSIVLGKMALLRGNVAIDPEILPAIDRANKYFGYYVNKGTIPYGEHLPELKAHSLNGKDEMLAVMFALQGNTYNTQAEYFSRISIAGYNGRELGHNGNGFNYLWECLGANVGGSLATSAYFNKIKWNLDLARRNDGSFSYDGQRDAAHAGSNTYKGTYLGWSDYFGINPTAWNILTYAAPLKTLYITGKTPFTTNLNADAVSNAITAGEFQLTSASASNDTLVTKLGDYDPIVREEAAKQLKLRMTSAPLTTTQINSLVASITTGSLGSTNAQIGACRVLGLLKTPNALPPLIQRLSDANLWIRASAAKALADWGPADSGQINTMLDIYANNATDPDTINWSDPIQAANGLLSDALFKTRPNKTIEAPTDLLYPAIKTALKQPDSIPRKEAANFTSDYFSYYDAKSLVVNLVECVKTRAQANLQTSMLPREFAMQTLLKFRFIEGIPAAMALLDVPRAFDWKAGTNIQAGLNALVSYGDASKPQLDKLRAMEIAWPNSDVPQLKENKPNLTTAIGKIQASIANSSNDILTFQFPGLTQPNATISGTDISIQVPAGTDVTQLQTNYTVSPTANVMYKSGIKRNFTTPQLYPIVASDRNLTVKTYTVTVTQVPGIKYEFNSGDFQGWYNRVWDGNAWKDLPTNVSAHSPIYPTWNENNLFGLSDGAIVSLGTNLGYHHNTQWLRSPQFYLNIGTDLTVKLSGGVSKTSVAPADDRSVPYAAIINGGWQGVGLRRVSDGVFVLTKTRTGSGSYDYQTLVFTQAELNKLNRTVPYTLELINSDYQDWGWLKMDDVFIPGSTTTPLPSSGITALTGVTAWSPDRVDTFAIGADKTLFWKYWNGSVWSPYSSLSANVSAGVGATNWGPNRLDVFYSGNSGSMRHKWYTGSWSPEEDLGGTLVGAPAATSWATNRIDVFCRGTDNRLYWNYYNGSWSTWAAPSASADVYSSPAVTNWGPNRLDVFYAGINGSLRHKRYTGSWSPEEDLGGIILGGPSAVAWSYNRMDVIVRGTDSQLYWIFWNGLSWSGFQALNTYASSDPTVTSRGSGTFDVFYRAANGGMKQKSCNAGIWSSEYDLGVPSFSGVTARTSLVSMAPSVPVVTAISTATVLQVPWMIGSIGSSTLTGKSIYNAGTISQSGSGSLGITRDKLNFSYQTLSGDGEITAKINALQNTGMFSGVGVMIRDTLATNSKHVFMGMTGKNSYVTASRITTGGIATASKTGTGTVPNTWVKLARIGNVITASKSLDGRTWTAVGSTKVVMGTNCYIGLVVSSGSDSVLNNSQFTHLSVTP